MSIALSSIGSRFAPSNAAKALLGQTLSSAKDITTYAADPATYLAGLVVSRTTSATAQLSVLASAGMRVGVSAGRSLSDHKKTSVIRCGERVPIRAHLKRARCTITITSYANLVSGTDDALAIAGTSFVAQASAVTPGDATFRAATGNNETATSLAAQINAHTIGDKVIAFASAAVVTLYAKAEGVGATGTGNDIAVAYTDNDSNIGLTLAGLSGGKMDGGSNTVSDIDYMTKGAKAYINDDTGKLDIAAFSGTLATVSDATYVDGPVIGIDEDGNAVAAGIVDMPGGL